MFTALYLFGTVFSVQADVHSPGKKTLTWHVKKGLTNPPNQAGVRHAPYSDAKVFPAEIPGFIDGKIRKEGVILGPNEHYDAMFNPAAWVAHDPRDGKEKIFLAPRAEKEQPGKTWEKISEAPLLVSDDGRNFTRYSDDAWLKATEPYELAGGAEDARYADLRLQPFIDTDGKRFDAAVMYTAFDGKTARISLMFFNHDNPTETRKKGLVFRDEDVLKNPVDPGNPAWNKSMAMRQVQDPETGAVRNFYFFGEGDHNHGGIMMMETGHPFSSRSDGAFGLTYPADAPVLRTREGFFDQGKVEAAFQPEVTRLPEKIAKKTGEKYGLTLSYHGDTPPWGYSVGYATFSMKRPGEVLYRSTGPYLKPTRALEKEGQVSKVVFASGKVQFKGEELIYYGSADLYISVASAPATKRIPGDPFFTYDPCRELLRNKHK